MSPTAGGEGLGGRKAERAACNTEEHLAHGGRKSGRRQSSGLGRNSIQTDEVGVYDCRAGEENKDASDQVRHNAGLEHICSLHSAAGRDRVMHFKAYNKRSFPCVVR